MCVRVNAVTFKDTVVLPLQNFVTIDSAMSYQ